MIEVIENSNLLDVQEGIICHQTNCIGVMDGGIALQIRKKWPKVYNNYREECGIFMSSPEYLLGHVQDVLVKDSLVVANCYGQVFPGQGFPWQGLMTDYKAWNIIFDKLKDLRCYFGKHLHFPYGIGCGLAGGDWSIMKAKLEHAFGKDKEPVYVHKLKFAA